MVHDILLVELEEFFSLFLNREYSSTQNVLSVKSLESVYHSDVINGARTHLAQIEQDDALGSQTLGHHDALKFGNTLVLHGLIRSPQFLIE